MYLILQRKISFKKIIDNAEISCPNAPIISGIVETDNYPSLPGIVGYYNTLLGIKLPKEPASGVYIIMYEDGTTEKRVKMKN